VVKLLDPLGSTEARGRVGGKVFNTWRGINYAKGKTSPAQPRSQAQLAVRGYLSKLVRQWASLPAVNQGWWNDYAVAHPQTGFGGTGKRLTGSNWFVMLNCRMLLMGYAVVLVPPADPAPGIPTGLTCTGSAGQVSIDWTAEVSYVNDLNCWFDGPHTAGRQGKIERAKAKGSWAGNAAGPVIINQLAPGTYTAFFKMQAKASGLSSPWVSVVFTIT
jgi:hypothetical protein